MVHLDPASAVFEAMLEGWATQQRARFLKANTIEPRLELVSRFATFANQYPWQWEPAEAEAFITRSPVAVSTARNYQVTLRLFCAYVADARYGWVARCLEHFGSVPQQILDEWNTVAHVTEFEGQPHRRPLTYDEVQALFDAADGRVEEIRSRGRKGALAAQRDAALLKTIYAGKGCGVARRGASTFLTFAGTRRCPSSRAMGRCLCDGASHLAAARRSGAPCSRCRRWTGRCPYCSSGLRRCVRISLPEIFRRCGRPSGVVAVPAGDQRGVR